VSAVQRAAGVDQQLLRVRGGALDEVGQFPGDPPNRCLGLVAALRRAQSLYEAGGRGQDANFAVSWVAARRMGASLSVMSGSRWSARCRAAARTTTWTREEPAAR
jgi:hypothetical protein